MAEQLAEQVDASETTVRDSGFFIAANARAGSFTAKLRNHGEVDGTTASIAALKRVSLGRPYVFRLELTRASRLVGDLDTWVLLQLEDDDSDGDDEDFETPERPVGKGDVPQAKLEKALKVAELVFLGKRPTPASVNVKSQRNVDYYLHAARLLGLLDRRNRMTSVGRVAFAEDPDERMLRIAMKFEEMKVAQEWVSWTGASRLADVDRSTAAAFLHARSSLKKGTIDTRASCLRTWHKLFSPYWAVKTRSSR